MDRVGGATDSVGTPGGGASGRAGRSGRLLAIAVALAAVTAVLALATALASAVSQCRVAAPAAGPAGQDARAAAGGSAGTAGPAAGAATRRVRAPGAREIVVDFDSGRLDLEAATGDVAAAAVELRWSGRPPSLRHRFENGVLWIVSRCPEPRRRTDRCRVHGRISVPDGARVRANVDAGTIAAEDLNSPSFEASSGAGNLSASFLRPPSSVEMTTNAGILDLVVPPASYAVDAGAGVGLSSIEIPDDPTAPRRLLARAAVGQVRISTR